MALLAFTMAAHAQVPTEYEVFLIPIVPSRIPGAFGSEWVTELAVTNVSDTPVYVTRNPSVVPRLFAPLPPRATEVLVALDGSGAVIGTLGHRGAGARGRRGVHAPEPRYIAAARDVGHATQHVTVITPQ